MLYRITEKRTHFLGIVLVKLRFAAISTPQAQYFIFWTVGHVDQTFIPPTLGNGTINTSQNEAIVSHLENQRKHRMKQAWPMTCKTDNEVPTSMNNMSPVESTPQCTVKDCLCICRLPKGFKSISLPC